MSHNIYCATSRLTSRQSRGVAWGWWGAIGQTPIPPIFGNGKYKNIASKKFHQFFKLTFAHAIFLLYNIRMSPHETFIQYLKVLLGIVSLIVISSWGAKVINLLTIIASK